jgi:ABC-type transporter Mla subunit MlaD
MPLPRVVGLNPAEMRDSVNHALDVVDGLAQQHREVLARVTEVELLSESLADAHTQLRHLTDELARITALLQSRPQQSRPQQSRPRRRRFLGLVR